MGLPQSSSGPSQAVLERPSEPLGKLRLTEFGAMPATALGGLSRAIFKLSWVSLGYSRGLHGALLEFSWGHLWAILGSNWGLLGALIGPSRGSLGTISDSPWAFSGPPRLPHSHLQVLKHIQESCSLRAVLDPMWDLLGPSRGAPEIAERGPAEAGPMSLLAAVRPQGTAASSTCASVADRGVPSPAL